MKRQLAFGGADNFLVTNALGFEFGVGQRITCTVRARHPDLVDDV
jgi:hypothetical protein